MNSLPTSTRTFWTLLFALRERQRRLLPPVVALILTVMMSGSATAQDVRKPVRPADCIALLPVDAPVAVITTCLDATKSANPVQDMSIAELDAEMAAGTERMNVLEYFRIARTGNRPAAPVELPRVTLPPSAADIHQSIQRQQLQDTLSNIDLSLRILSQPVFVPVQPIPPSRHALPKPY